MSRRTFIALLLQTRGTSEFLKSAGHLDRCLCSTLKKRDLVRVWRKLLLWSVHCHMYAALALFPFQGSRRGYLCFQDPTNHSTFSRVHAELERPLNPGGTQGSVGYYDYGRITPRNHNTRRTIIATVGSLRHFELSIAPVHATRRPTHLFTAICSFALRRETLTTLFCLFF